jgi:hypothetical protein
VAGATFKIDLTDTRPGASLAAWKDWRSGLLTIHDDRAEFEDRSGDRLVIGEVTRVTQPSRRQLRRDRDMDWIVNHWISVRYRSDGVPHEVFIAGRAPLGPFGLFGHYLSHDKIRRALESLVAPT